MSHYQAHQEDDLPSTVPSSTPSVESQQTHQNYQSFGNNHNDENYSDQNPKVFLYTTNNQNYNPFTGLYTYTSYGSNFNGYQDVTTQQEETKSTFRWRPKLPNWKWNGWSIFTFGLVIYIASVLLQLILFYTVVIESFFEKNASGEYLPFPFFSVAQKARGFIAIGQFATGVIAIGQISRGIITLGQIGCGLINVSMVGFGIFASVGLIQISAGFVTAIISISGYTLFGLITLTLTSVQYALIGVQLITSFFYDRNSDSIISSGNGTLVKTCICVGK